MQKRLREILIVDNYDSFTHNVAALAGLRRALPCGAGKVDMCSAH